MASSGDVQVVVSSEPGVAKVQQPAVETVDGGSSSSPETTTTTKEDSVMTTTELQEQHDMAPEPDHHEDAPAPPEQAEEVSAASSAEKTEEETKLPVAKEEADQYKAADHEDDHQAESTRERLKRHRQEVAGRVWVPEMWGQEKLLKDWVDCAVFDHPLVPAGLLTARRALVAESCSTRRPDRTSAVSPGAGSSPLRMRRTGAPNRSGAQSLLPPAASS